MGPGHEICQVAIADGSTYYIDVTSRMVYDLSECNAGTPVPGPLGRLFDSIEGFDKRCHYDPVSDPSVHAIVGVYSDGRAADVASARDQCAAHSGSNDGP
jgi:hypothetical protein